MRSSTSPKRTLQWYTIKFLSVFAFLAILAIISGFVGTVVNTSSSRTATTSDATLASPHVTLRKLLNANANETINVCVPKTDDGPGDACDIANFLSSEDLCVASLTPGHACNNKYLQLQFCNFGSIQWLYYIIMALWAFVLFYLLGDTAQEYFCPSLTKMSDYFRLSPNVAGVTLLALGNGSPDISSIIVSLLGSGSADFGIGGPIGAGVFVTTVVMGLVTLFADVKVTRRPFLRDVSFYLVAVAFGLYLYISGVVFLWQSILLLVLYLIYVIIVIVGRIIYQTRKKRRLTAANLKQSVNEKRIKNKAPELGARLLDDDSAQQATSTGGASGATEGAATGAAEGTYGQIVADEQDADANSDNENDGQGGDWTGGWRMNSMPVFPTGELDTRRRGVTFTEETIRATEEIEEQQQQQGAAAGSSINNSNSNSSEPVVSSDSRFHAADSFRNRNESQFNLRNAYLPKFGVLRETKDGSVVVKEYFPDSGEGKTGEAEMEEVIEEKNPVKRVINSFLDSIEWQEKRWHQRILFIVLYAFWTLARNLTIPKAEGWNKYFMMLTPIFSPLWVLFAAGPTSFITLVGGVFPLAIIIAACGSLFSIAIFFTSRRTKPPKYFPIFVFACFGMSIVWIYIIANELLTLLSALGAAWNIPQSVLAITVLAWGNSIGDMISNIVIARQGYPSMSVGACYGGPLLNLLLGLGIALTFAPSTLRDGCTPLGKSPTVMLSFLFLIVSLVMTLIVVPVSKFRSRRPYGIVLLVLYVVYLVLAITAAKVDHFGKIFVF